MLTSATRVDCIVKTRDAAKTRVRAVAVRRDFGGAEETFAEQKYDATTAARRSRPNRKQAHLSIASMV